MKFFAFISRMKFINRWSLMRNTSYESLSVHSHEVAMVAHALCVIGNKRLGKNYNDFSKHNIYSFLVLFPF